MSVKDYVLRPIALILICVITVLGYSVFGYWLWLRANPEMQPKTSEITYSGLVKDKLTGEEEYFMRIDYWQNLDNSGKEVIEFIFTSYSDYEAGAVIQKGAQFVFDRSKNGLGKAIDDAKAAGQDDRTAKYGNIDKWETQYYDKAYGMSWLSIDGISYDSNYYLMLNDEAYNVLLNGQYHYVVKKPNYWKVAGEGIKGFFTGTLLPQSEIMKLEKVQDTVVDEWRKYTMNDFYKDVFLNLTKTNLGEGSYVLSLVELSKYFTIQKYNTENKQFESVSTADYQDRYFAVRCNIHTAGMQKSADSNFGMFLQNNHWNALGLSTEAADYAVLQVGTALTAADMYYTIDPVLNAICPRIKDSVAEYLVANNIGTVNVVLDLNDVLFDAVTIPNVLIKTNFKGAYAGAVNITINLGGKLGAIAYDGGAFGLNVKNYNKNGHHMYFRLVEV
jgi:hypothetical protein